MDKQLIEGFIQEYHEFMNAFQQKAQERFKEVFKQFWEENPGINCVVWTQYAPYFNDGDPCEFSVHYPTFSNATDVDDINDINWGEYDGNSEGIWAYEDYSIKKLKDKTGVNEESVKLLASFIESTSMEKVLETMFGSDNRIVATRQGFEVQDYSSRHD